MTDLAIVGLDDPAKRGSWSGTPANLAAALERSGVSTLPLHIQPRLGEKALGATLATCGGASPREWRRPSQIRHLLGSRARRSVARSGATAALHMGSLTLPNAPTPWRTLCFLDSTLAQWRQGSRETSLGRTSHFGRIDASEKHRFALVNHFFVVSQATKRSLVEHYEVPSHKVSITGTGLGFRESPIPKKGGWSTPNLLFIARQRFLDKGADLLLEAYREAHKVNPHLHLTVVGGGPHFQKELNSLGITVHDRLTVQQLHGEFRKASLLVLPAFNEPWGLVYLEALAFGVPIMGFDRNAFPEIAGNGEYGYVVTDTTARGLASAILAAVADPDVLERKGRAGRSSLGRFDWDKIAQVVSAQVSSER